jgi:hypothetical protein
MRPAREASWRDVEAASSINSDVDSLAIEEIDDGGIGGALTCDTDSEWSYP